jgi:hypothetical protein
MLPVKQCEIIVTGNDVYQVNRLLRSNGLGGELFSVLIFPVWARSLELLSYTGDKYPQMLL